MGCRGRAFQDFAGFTMRCFRYKPRVRKGGGSRWLGEKQVGIGPFLTHELDKKYNLSMA